MRQSSSFADEVVPLLREEVEALHGGDLAPRLALWSRTEPLTLFGAWRSGSGWAEIEPVFAALGETFRGSRRLDYEVIAAESSGDLGYVVALEHSTAVVGADGPRDYTLRVTTILRREGGAWKVVHRHGDEDHSRPRNPSN
jgi:ketosteroid isomerase-like protein